VLAVAPAGRLAETAYAMRQMITTSTSVDSVRAHWFSDSGFDSGYPMRLLTWARPAGRASCVPRRK